MLDSNKVAVILTHLNKGNSPSESMIDVFKHMLKREMSINEIILEHENSIGTISKDDYATCAIRILDCIENN